MRITRFALVLAVTGCGTGQGETAATPITDDAGGGGPLAEAAVPLDGGSAADASVVVTAGYPLPLPAGFPTPYVPTTNPLTAEKVCLGRHLFYDERLSGNGTQSCASCHEQAKAFTDGKRVGIGSTGQAHPRNSMTLVNVAYAATLTWANPVLRDFESQTPVPMFGIDPVIELGIRGKEDEVLARLKSEPKYASLFAAAFPTQGNPFTFENIVKAISSFERTLVSGNSRFDRYRTGGDTQALTEQEKRGSELFGSESLECFHCHGGFNFSDAVVHEGIDPAIKRFHNTGLYNIGGNGDFPIESRGLIDFTANPADMGKFKAPTLRNVEKTAPYMHDGSIETLEEVVEHYAAGGRTIASGPHAGVGSSNPYKSSFLVSFDISAEDKAALVAFLRSLTDDEFLTNPAFSNPWK